MLHFFKTNNPYLLIFTALVLFALRLPVFLGHMPLMLPELKWLMIGERLGTQDVVMYQGIWDYTAPLSAWVYQGLYLLFGRTVVAYQALGTAVVLLQSILFNRIMLQNKAYRQPTYLPALIYVLFMNACFDFLTLSPVLMSLTFLLLVMNNLFKRIDHRTKDPLFISTGVYLGLAMLCYLPSVCFLLATILVLMVYTSTRVRRILLLVYGFLITLIFAGIYFYWHDAFLLFQRHFLSALWLVPPVDYLSWTSLVYLFAAPLLLFVFSFYYTQQNGRYINFQIKIQQVMLLLMVASIPAMWMARERSTWLWIYFVPGIAFFVTHHLLLIKRRRWAEIYFGGLLLTLALNLLTPLYGWFSTHPWVNYDALWVKPHPYQALTSGKTTLVIGNDHNPYQHARLATPYFNWAFSQSCLTELNFRHGAHLFTSFQQDPPEVIIDQKGVIPPIFDILPTIARQYARRTDHPEVYERKR